MPSRYDPLIAFLAAQPAEVRSVTLTFAQAAVLLGGPVPVAARGPQWWRRRPPPAHRPGWRPGSPHIDAAGWAVTFRRAPPATTEEPLAPGRP